MTRISKSAWRALAALTLAAGSAAAQVTLPSDNTAYGTTAGEFLLLGASARGLALGGAYAALATDISALYYNPAGVAQMSRPGAMVSSYNYIANTRYVWGGLAPPMARGVHAVGGQVGNFGFSCQPVYTGGHPTGDGTSYSVAETFAGVTLAQNFSDRFSAHTHRKVISLKLR